jgi:hypothetical protein
MRGEGVGPGERRRARLVLNEDSGVGMPPCCVFCTLGASLTFALLGASLNRLGERAYLLLPDSTLK